MSLSFSLSPSMLLPLLLLRDRALLSLERQERRLDPLAPLALSLSIDGPIDRANTDTDIDVQATAWVIVLSLSSLSRLPGLLMPVMHVESSGGVLAARGKKRAS